MSVQHIAHPTTPDLLEDAATAARELGASLTLEQAFEVAFQAGMGGHDAAAPGPRGARVGTDPIEASALGPS